MPIGTSDGQQYETEFDHVLGQLQMTSEGYPYYQAKDMPLGKSQKKREDLQQHEEFKQYERFKSY